MVTFNKVCAVLIFITVFLCPLLSFPAHAITVTEEEELGREFIKLIKRRYNIVTDPFISQYIEKIGQRILKEFPPQHLTYHFYVVKEDVYNAFAGPGGHVFVNSGLFEAMETEPELIGILSHEIAHVSCRHISQKIERSTKIEMATLAGLAAGILLGVGGSGSAAQAVTVSTMAAGQSLSLAYSRDDERQADEVGLKYMEKAGYDATGLMQMLKKIKTKNWYGAEIPTYLKTHPGADERIVYLSRRLEEKTATDSPTPLTGPDDFKKAHMRILALYGNKDNAQKTFEKMLAEDANNYLGNYGMGLLLVKDNNPKGAQRYFKKALERQAFDPFLLTDLGHVYYLSGDFESALQTLESARGIDAKNKEGWLLLGRAQVELEKFEAATETFHQLIVAYPDFSSAYYYLGDAYHRLSRSAPEHYYLGMSYKIKGDYEKALFNLKRAKTDVKEAVLKEKIDTAMKEIEEEKKKKKRK